uniref:Ig-like domain-containing protein n=1 Tax=Oryzias latipes TaxID=8090 RepID=A0A3B3H7W7_ORYLA
MENVVGFPPDAPNFAKVKTEALASFHNAIVQNKSEINESRQENLKTESPKRHWTAAEGQHMDRSTHRETREKCLSEIVMDSESISITTDSPLVVNSLKDICAEENSNTLFTATIKNVTKVLWYFNGQLVKSGTEFMCSKHHDTYTLAINTVAKENSCCLRRSSKVKHVTTNELFCSFLILVEHLPPVFLSKPESQAVYVGKKALIQCAIGGSTPLNVVWLKGDQSLPEVPEHYHFSCENNEHTLEISNVGATDQGLYVCRVSNSVGMAECSMELRVIEKPNFVKPMCPVALVIGAPLHLECQVDEDTGVIVNWTRDGKKIHQSPDLMEESISVELQTPLERRKPVVLCL